MAKKKIITEEIVEVVEETVEETVEKVAKAAKKAAGTVKKAATKKDIKTSIVLQYEEKEVDSKDMIAAVKKEWTKAKHKVGEIKTMELYLKPEDDAVYYVINGEFSGKIQL